MSFEHRSTNQPSLFTEPESASASPAPRVKSARSANRAAWWQRRLASRRSRNPSAPSSSYRTINRRKCRPDMPSSSPASSAVSRRFRWRSNASSNRSTKTSHNALVRRIAPSRTGSEHGGQLMRYKRRTTDASPTRLNKRTWLLRRCCGSFLGGSGQSNLAQLVYTTSSKSRQLRAPATKPSKNGAPKSAVSRVQINTTVTLPGA
jgi:hypothetical protein